ncbi:MAG: FKBP-type peptidyl-prolyl cis-trans isomerase [Cyclobacteriaceae bacterium]|nr:FKBP-type peptidyl-prolyl cis-trans isomerase [Cyclobacteriaceae bacterium]
MKRVLIFCTAALMMLACKKEDCSTPSFTVDQQQLADDIILIDQYLADNGITAEVHNTGIRYEIVKPGTGIKPDNCSKVYVRYRGEFLDGTIFEETPLNTPLPEFVLGSLVSGWQVGIPLIKEQGEINLYIPSGYAYGPTGSGSTIPANTPLIFNIELFGVVNPL